MILPARQVGNSGGRLSRLLLLPDESEVRPRAEVETCHDSQVERQLSHWVSAGCGGEVEVDGLHRDDELSQGRHGLDL